jgi:hypothetical protein
MRTPAAARLRAAISGEGCVLLRWMTRRPCRNRSQRFQSRAIFGSGAQRGAPSGTVGIVRSRMATGRSAGSGIDRSRARRLQRHRRGVGTGSVPRAGEVAAPRLEVNGCKISDRRLTRKNITSRCRVRGEARRGGSLPSNVPPALHPIRSISGRRHLALGFRVVRLRIAEHVSRSGAARPCVPLGREIAIPIPTPRTI